MNKSLQKEEKNPHLLLLEKMYYAIEDHGILWEDSKITYSTLTTVYWGHQNT